MTRFEINPNIPRPVYSLPPLHDPEKIRLDLLAKYTSPNYKLDWIPPKYNLTPPVYNATPPVNPQADRFTVAVYACFFGSLSTLFTALILTRTSFESKTKTAISFAGGATVGILTCTNPLIGLVACAILGALACTISKEPSSTDGFLRSISHDDRHNFPRIDHALLQRDRDAFLQRQEQMLQNLLPIRPLVYPMVIHPLDRMPPPRFVLPHFFFDHLPAVPDLQPGTFRAKGG